jgi:hypothetical protein
MTEIPSWQIFVMHPYVDDNSARNQSLTVENFRTTVMVPFDKHDFSDVRLSSIATSSAAMIIKYKCDWKDA